MVGRVVKDGSRVGGVCKGGGKGPFPNYVIPHASKQVFRTFSTLSHKFLAQKKSRLLRMSGHHQNDNALERFSADR